MQEHGLVHSFLKQSALTYPEKIALIQGAEQVTYGELARRANQISQWLLNRKIQPGDRVAILTDQACEYVAAYFGILAAGGIVVGLNTQTSNNALSSVLSDSGSSIVLSHKKFQKYASVINTQASVRHFETNIRSLWESEECAESETSSPDKCRRHRPDNLHLRHNRRTQRGYAQTS